MAAQQHSSPATHQPSKPAITRSWTDTTPASTILKPTSSVEGRAPSEISESSTNVTVPSIARATTRSPTKDPSPPHPDSDAWDVHIFLRDFFLANNLYEDFKIEDAAQRAALLSVNGESLYKTSEDSFVETFGAQGEILYKIVQGGPWGYYRKGAFGYIYGWSRSLYISLAAALPPGSSSSTTLQKDSLSSLSSASDSLDVSCYSTVTVPSTPSSFPRDGQRSSRSETRLPQQMRNGHSSKERWSETNASGKEEGLRVRRNFHADERYL